MLSPKFLLIHGGLSTMSSMKWHFADRFFIPRWRRGPSHFNQQNLRCPNANLICLSLIPRSPKLALPNLLRRLMPPRRPNGIRRGPRSCPMALVSVFGTIWVLVAPARRAVMRTNAPVRNLTESRARDSIWPRSIRRRLTDQVTSQRNGFCHIH